MSASSKKKTRLSVEDWAAQPPTHPSGRACSTCACDPEMLAFVVEAVQLIDAGRSRKNITDLHRYCISEYGYKNPISTFRHHVRRCVRGEG